MANNKQKVLGLNDLCTVLTEIHSVRAAKWYNIGLQLSVQVPDLQRIESEYKNDHGTCLRHMLIKWLEMGCATWKALVDALQSTIVQGSENTALAETLRQRYCGEVGEEEGKNKGKKGKTTQTTSARSNSSGGTSAAANTLEKTNTNSDPTRDCQSASADGTSKSQENPSAVASKAGEAGASKAKKRLQTSVSPGPSAAKKPKVASTKLPDSFARDDFQQQPKVDRLCVRCERVPYNPQRSVCCRRLYCEPCSKKNKRCSNRTHKADLQYTSDKELYSKIQKLKIKCPNQGGRCNWTDTVLNLKHHLPACGGGHTQGKGAGVQKKKRGEKASKTHSKATESGPLASVAMADQIHTTAADSGSSNGTSLSTATGEGQNTETTGAAKPIGEEANESRITVEDVQGTSASTASCLPLNMPCEYRAIGCEERVHKGKMKEHLQGSIQHHLDLAIKRILQNEMNL